MRCTQVADQPFHNGEFSCRDWVIAVVLCQSHMTTNPLTAIVRKGFDDICRDLSYAIADQGFSRTKTRLWVRYADDAIDVLSLYREGSSYGAPIGGNLDVRIQSYFRRPFDTTPHLILNGPQSDIARTRSGQYHLRFNAKSRHMYDRCLTDLVRFVNDECEPWFVEMKTSAPLIPRTAGEDPRASEQSRKLLGLDRIFDN